MTSAVTFLQLVLLCSTSLCWGYTCSLDGDDSSLGGRCGVDAATSLDDAIDALMANLSLVLPKPQSIKGDASCKFDCLDSQVDGKNGSTDAFDKVDELIEGLKNLTQQLEENLSKATAEENLRAAVKIFMVDRDWPKLEKVLETVLEPSDPALEQARDISWTDGKHALLDIVMNGRKELLTLLLDYDLDANLQWGPNNSTMMHAVAVTGRVDLAELLHSRGALVDSLAAWNVTPLLRAATVHQPQMITWLLGQGADVHAKDTHGWTALHFAAKADVLKSVKILVKNGAIKEALNEKGHTARDEALEFGFIEVANFLAPDDPFDNAIPPE